MTDPVVSPMNDVEVIVTKYRCVQCGAEDHDRSTDPKQVPEVLNCWSCGAGYQKDKATMFRLGLGMLPVEAVEEGSDDSDVSLPEAFGMSPLAKQVTK